MGKKVMSMVKDGATYSVISKNNQMTAIPVRQRPTDAELGWEDPVITKMEENIKIEDLQQQEQEQEQVNTKLETKFIDEDINWFDEQTENQVEETPDIKTSDENSTNNEIQSKIDEIENRKDKYYTNEELRFSVKKYWSIYDELPKYNTDGSKVKVKVETKAEALGKGVIREVGVYKGMKMYAQASWLWDSKLFTESQRQEIISECFKKFIAKYDSQIQTYLDRKDLWDMKPRSIWFSITDNYFYDKRFHTFICRDELWLCNSNFVNYYNDKILPSILNEIDKLRKLEVENLKLQIKSINVANEIEWGEN